jgi:deazaflavin-dependent oxidoreductase (nitroreductase family)
MRDPVAGPTNPVARWFLRAPIALFRMRLGWLFGGRLVLLVTTGRTSGRIRRTVVEVARSDPAQRTYWVVAGWGRGSDWYRNALAHPPLLIDTGRTRLISPAVHELTPAERLELLGDYQQRYPRVAKVLGERVLGADFTAAPEDLERLADALGALRFSPGGQTPSAQHADRSMR